MNKQRFAIILAVVCLLAACFALVACDNNGHVHQLGKFEVDENEHWRICTECGEKVSEAHTFGEKTVVSEPTEKDVGVAKQTCTVCGYTVYSSIPALNHKHVFSGEYLFDETQHWQACSCGEKQTANHIFGEWTETKAATIKEKGEERRDCTVCDYYETRETDKIPHEHVFGDYQYDEVNHWQTCSCGEKQTANHTFGEWTETKAATATEKGEERRDCTVCDYYETRETDKIQHKHVFGDYQYDENEHWQTCACGYTKRAEHTLSDWKVITAATTSGEGTKRRECVCGYYKEGKIPTILSQSATVNFYAINDFHGSVDKIAQIGSYLKTQKKNNPNTVLINSGDMFQGSIQSNSNYGKLLTECMDEIGFSAMTYGNHEFDWGMDVLKDLAKYGNTPFLGANIYHWDPNTRQFGTFADEIAQEYVTVTLPNKVKVGIIGVIGKDQITSINSNLVENIGFVPPMDVIPNLSTKLRDEEGCHVVVVSIHANVETLSVYSDIDQYADAVFCAHSHQVEKENVNGTPFLQGGSYGKYVSYVTLNVSNSNVTLGKYGNTSFQYSWTKDAAVTAIVDKYNKQIEGLAGLKLATVDGELGKTGEMPNLAARAIAEFAVSRGYDDIVLGMINVARNSIYEGTITYSDLYEALPFDNVVYIAEVTGANLYNVANSNYIWRVSAGKIYNDTKHVYKVAVIDYVLFHQNSNREYDRFYSAFEKGRMTPIPLYREDGSVYNYREITRDFMTAQGTINAEDYKRGGNPRVDPSSLTSNVTFASTQMLQTNTVVNNAYALVPGDFATVKCYKRRFAA